MLSNVSGFITTDCLRSSGVFTSAAGAVLWAWPYAANPFGEAQSVSATGYVLNLRFPGQYQDSEAGLKYNVNRSFDAATGRYIQSDPLGLAAGPSTYLYVDGNPLVQSDSLGLDWVYHQRTGQLEHVDENGNVRRVGNGYSGQGNGVNNPDMQNVPDSGPLPRGQYTIGQQRDNRTGAGHQLPGSMRLNPSTGNDMQGRAGFLIHGPHANDQMDSSNGCPIFSRDVRNQIGQGVSSGDNQLRVVE
ncbi:RHS repeat-associated core domain-containing protein [Luteibacter sp. PPL552]